VSKSFVLRLDPEHFNQLQKRAQKLGISINALCVSLLKVDAQAASKALDPVLSLILNAFAGSVIGVILYGSVARGTQTSSSDIDLLIVLKESTAIDSKLYKKWDAATEEHFKDQKTVSLTSEVSPSFVHLPKEPELSSGLWLEVALEGKILWEQDRQIQDTLHKLRQLIAEGKFLKSYTYGVPYWKRAG
jgi:predicted nucleotidyltransferase